MFAQILGRLCLPATGVLFAAGAIVQSVGLDRMLSSWPKSPGVAASAAKDKQAAPAPRSRVVAEGRVTAYPGAEVVVGTEAAGRIVRMTVEEKSVVRKGELIAELNADDLKASLGESLAHVAEAEADIRFYERELHRDEVLLVKRAGTPQGLDTSRRGLDGARARRAAALAEAERYRALIAKTRVVAPIDGVVTARQVHPGETVEINRSIVTIADLDRLRIEAEVDEFDTGRVVLDAPVTITAEGFDHQSWRGRIEEVPDSVVPRRLRPEDPGRPIDARVLPAKIAFGEKTPLKLGQRVEVEIARVDGHAR